MIIIVDLLSRQCSEVTKALTDLLVKFYVNLKGQENQENSKHKEVVCKQYCQKIISEVTNSFNLLSLFVSAFSTMEADPAVLAPISNSVINFIDNLCAFFGAVREQEKSMEKVLKPTFIVESAHPYIFELKDTVTITCKGAESFKLKYSAQSKFPPMEFLKAIRVVNSSN